MSTPIVFSTRTSARLADDIAHDLGAERGRLRVEPFPDGETGHRLEEGTTSNLHRRPAIVVGAAENDASYLELCDIIAGLRDHHAALIHAVIPYLYCSTQERPGPKREFTKGLNRVRGLLAMHPTRVTFFDLHAQGIKDAHDGSAQVDHLSSEPLMADLLRERENLDRLVLVSPDAGRGEWVQSLARRLGIPYTIADKRRISGDAVAMGQLGRIVEGRDAVVVDDMCRMGSTLLGTLSLLKQLQINTIDAIFTHAIMPHSDESHKDPETILAKSEFRCIYTTNSHPRSHEIKDKKFIITNISHLIANHIAKYLK